jgi:hypothetical protein
MNYGDLLSEAFRITWRNKFLWFFGFFVGGASFNFPSTNFGGRGGMPFGSVSGPLRWISENLILFLVIVGVLAAVLALVFIVLAMISHGALAETVAALHRGEASRFGTAWRAGTTYFWRVIWLKGLFFLMALGLALLIFLPAVGGVVAVFFSTESVGLRVLSVVLGVLFVFALLILIFLPFAIVNQFALRELVLGGRRVMDSIGGGFGLFRHNVGRSLLAWLVQLGVMLGLGIATLVVIVILAVILLGPAVALFAAERTATAVVVGVTGGLLFLIPVLVISGALSAFNHAYWTLAYLQLTAPADRDAHMARG